MSCFYSEGSLSSANIDLWELRAMFFSSLHSVKCFVSDALGRRKYAKITLKQINKTTDKAANKA